MSLYENRILNLGFSVGTRAIDTYDTCCDLFEFDPNLRGKFAAQKKLYAKHATPEGYNVWMFAHSNLIEDFNKSRTWFNIIDGNIIREVWFDTTDANTEDFTPRVCFFKTKSGRYVFGGVYVLDKCEIEKVYSSYEFVRTFKRISTTYPVNVKIAPQNTYAIPNPKESIKNEQIEVVNVEKVSNNCIIDAYIIESDKKTSISVDIDMRPNQKFLIGKKIGDIFSFPNINLTYRIEKIFIKKPI